MIRKSLSRKIHDWYEQYRIPPADAISEGRDYSTGARIAPLYRYPRRKPSAEICGELLSAFSRMYDEWDKVFSEIGRPYDLQLWIFDTHFMDCQLVCTPVESPGDQRNDYFHPCPEQYEYPSNKYGKYRDFDPEYFRWTTFEVRRYLFEKEDHLSERRIRRLLKDGWREDPRLLNGPERAFWHIYDFVWVGRKMKADPASK